MLAIRPALGTWFDSLRRAAASEPIGQTKVKRFEQPVPKVTRNRGGDMFETAADELKHGIKRDWRQDVQQDLRQASFRSATPPPKSGVTNVTHFLHRDGFETATRKPVELAPKPPPSLRAGVAVFRFR